MGGHVDTGKWNGGEIVEDIGESLKGDGSTCSDILGTLMKRDVSFEEYTCIANDFQDLTSTL